MTHKENPSTSSWHTPKLLWVPADSQCGICCSWFTKSTLIWRGELTGQGCGASSTQHRGCCCLSAPEMLTQTHHRLTGESPLHPGLYRGFTRSALLACSPHPKTPKMYQLSKPRLQSWGKKSKQTSESPNGGRKLPPVLQEVSLYNPKVCGGDDINTHSGISLPAQLRSSWEAHSSALRCLLKSPAFLCTSLTTALCAPHSPMHCEIRVISYVTQGRLQNNPEPSVRSCKTIWLSFISSSKVY